MVLIIITQLLDNCITTKVRGEMGVVAARYINLTVKLSCLVAGGVLVFWMILVTTGFVPLVLQRKTKTVRTKQRRRKRKKARRRENNIQ